MIAQRLHMTHDTIYSFKYNYDDKVRGEDLYFLPEPCPRCLKLESGEIELTVQMRFTTS